MRLIATFFSQTNKQKPKSIQNANKQNFSQLLRLLCFRCVFFFKECIFHIEFVQCVQNVSRLHISLTFLPLSIRLAGWLAHCLACVEKSNSQKDMLSIYAMPVLNSMVAIKKKTRRNTITTTTEIDIL